MPVAEPTVTSESRPPRASWVLWRRMAASILLGACALSLVGLAGLANESQSSAPPAAYAFVCLVLAAVAIRVYVLLQRSRAAISRAVLGAALAVPVTVAVPVAVLWLLVEASS